MKAKNKCSFVDFVDEINKKTDRKTALIYEKRK